MIARLLELSLAVGMAAILVAHATLAAEPIRALLPASSPLSASWDQAMDAEAQASHAKLERKGSELSTISELTAARLAGTLPDLALVEAAELPAILEMKLAHTIPPARARALTGGMPEWALKTARDSRQETQGRLLLVPFLGMLPVLLVDQEKVFRVHQDPIHLPKDWKSWLALAEKLAAPDAESCSLELPLQGPRGLWILEALAGKPLWKRESGGLRANRELLPTLRELRSALSKPKFARSDESWDRAVQSFVSRRCPLLITSMEALPYVVSHAEFRWKAVPVPRPTGGLANTYLGLSWVLLNDKPEGLDFLDRLYQKDSAMRWLPPGGWIGLKPSWEKSLSPALRSWDGYLELAQLLKAPQPRTQDPDSIRARAAFIQVLPALIGEPQGRLDLDAWLAHLDEKLNAGAAPIPE